MQHIFIDEHKRRNVGKNAGNIYIVSLLYHRK